MWPTLRPGDQVTAEPVAVGDLRIGDWVLLRGSHGPVLHRFLGFTREGLLLTKGDGHRAPDSPWPREALLARAVALSRRGRTIPISSSSLCERARTGVHRLMAASWSLLRRVGLVLLLLAAALALISTAAGAAVDLVSFEAASDGQVIRVTWETASEVDSFGFYVLRALQEGGEYTPVSDFIEAAHDITGYSYKYTDADVELGNIYYYRLEAVDVHFVSEFYGPIAVTHPPLPTETPTPTSTSTPQPSPTPSATPSSNSPKPGSNPTPREPMIQFWADPERISRGECAVVHWWVENVQAIYFQGQSATGREDRQVCPRQTATYTLRVVTDEGEETRQVTVSVQGDAPSSPTSTSTPTPTPRPPTSTATPRPTFTHVPPSPTSTPASGSPAPTATSSVQVGGTTPTSTPSPTPTPSPAHVAASSPTRIVTASPTPTPAPASTRRPAASGEPALPCGLLLALVGGGVGLVLLGVWGFWRTRKKG